MKIALSWLQEFVPLHESPDELRAILDDLGLVVEGVEVIGEGLGDVVVARVDQIQLIEGADRIRLITVDAGEGPIDIVCGAMNFAVGQHVPLAPVGAVLPGGFEIARRKMKGVVSNGMLCSARELRLSDDHEGLMILDDLISPVVGTPLMEALSITPDVVFDISVEGNRPDAWSVEGVARDLATRLGRALSEPDLAAPDHGEPTGTFASAAIEDPDLCGRLTVSALRGVSVGPSPDWVRRRIESAGMRPISNVVDASNLVMLELGQPTHPYDAAKVAHRTIRVRRARPGESLETLDGVVRELAKAGRGLGDTGEDCVIVDGDDRVIGLAGIMGGASSEISADTTEVLLEAAYFDPMTIARSSKRHGLRSEASNRFERGVDPHLALRAVARFVQVLRESCPSLQWMPDPLDLWGTLTPPPTVTIRPGDVERALGLAIPESEVVTILKGLKFNAERSEAGLVVTPPTSRSDVRAGAAGRADVIEEIARLYSYRRLPRRTPTWPQPGGLNDIQKFRRRVRDTIVDLGTFEVWTASLVSDSEFDVVHAGHPRVRITNPLASEESVLRATLLTGLVKTWARNEDRGTGNVIVGEIGTVFRHPESVARARVTKGGSGGTVSLALPEERERLTIVLGRPSDDATSAVALWSVLADRLGLDDVVLRTVDEVPAGLHPTRAAALVDRRTSAILGFVGEVDPAVVGAVTSYGSRRLGVVDVDMAMLGDPESATRRSRIALMPSRYPSASIDLALVTPERVHASDLMHALRAMSTSVESVTLFDVYRGGALPPETRSLALNIRLNSAEHTLSEREIQSLREELIATAQSFGATLRS